MLETFLILNYLRNTEKKLSMANEYLQHLLCVFYKFEGIKEEEKMSNNEN